MPLFLTSRYILSAPNTITGKGPQGGTVVPAPLACSFYSTRFLKKKGAKISGRQAARVCRARFACCGRFLRAPPAGAGGLAKNSGSLKSAAPIRRSKIEAPMEERIRQT